MVLRFPYLTQDIKTAPTLKIPRADDKGFYEFKAYSFGELGSYMSYELIHEISEGLTKSVRRHFPDFDVVAGISYGGRWGFLIAYNLEKDYVQFWSTYGYRRCFLKALADSGLYKFVKVTSAYDKKIFCYHCKSFKMIKENNEKVLVVDDVISSGKTLDTILNELINKLDVKVVGTQAILAKSDDYKKLEEKWGMPIKFLKKVRR